MGPKKVQRRRRARLEQGRGVRTRDGTEALLARGVPLPVTRGARALLERLDTALFHMCPNGHDTVHLHCRESGHRSRRKTMELCLTICNLIRLPSTTTVRIFCVGSESTVDKPPAAPQRQRAAAAKRNKQWRAVARNQVRLLSCRSHRSDRLQSVTAGSSCPRLNLRS